MIKPFIFIDPNQCPYCLGKLIFRETEIFEARLDEYGVPIGGETMVQPKLVCSKCGKIYDCERKGLGYQIDCHLPKTRPIVKEYNPFYE